MKMKVRYIIFIGIFIVFYYHFFFTGRKFNNLRIFQNSDPLDDLYNLELGEEFDPYRPTYHFTKKMIQNAMEEIKKLKNVSLNLTEILEQELKYQSLSQGNVQEIPSERDENDYETQIPPPPTAPTFFPLTPYPRRFPDSQIPLYIITPTYKRSEQIADLTKMSHTLMLLENVRWLIVEDSKTVTREVSELIAKTGLEFVHLPAPVPERYKKRKELKGKRRIFNRNRALQWLRANATRGVLYFADSDNAYDLALFQEIKKTRKVSIFPVGLLDEFGFSSPIVRNGLFSGFLNTIPKGRKFPVDMAGFAVNIEFLHQRSHAYMPYISGYQEDGFLRSLAPFEPQEFELLAENCTKILVWHMTNCNTTNVFKSPNMELYDSTNFVKLKQQVNR